LEERLARFARYSHRYDLPYAYFKESKDALNGTLTCVGIIVDEVKINTPNVDLDYKYDQEFIDLLCNSQRAR